MYQQFISHYGASRETSRSGMVELGFSDHEMLGEFLRQTGGGLFQGGFLSLLSVREKISNLGGWEYWLPKGIKIFGSSALGMFFATSGNDLWLVDCEYGQVVESDMPISEFINSLVEDDIREDFLREFIFLSWSKNGLELPEESVLAPTPAISLAGSWDVSSLSIMDFSIYLSFTAQLFSPESGAPADVYRNE